MKDSLRAICVEPVHTIRDVMQLISDAALHGAPTGIALVVDDEDRLKGVITDGDLRRALVAGRSVDDPGVEIMVSNPITVPPGMTADQMLLHMTEKVSSSGRIRDVKVEFLIVADEQERVIDVLHTVELLIQADISRWPVGVVGLGFVGLTLAVTLADVGFEVHGVDHDSEAVDGVAAGRPRFYERGLEPLLEHQLADNRLQVHSSLPAYLSIFVIAVGTPVDADGVPLLDNIRDAAASVASVLAPGSLVVLRSTLPVGATRAVVLPILEEGSGLTCGRDFHLVFAPERTVEGNALKELRMLPQIVGGFDKRSEEVGARFFGKFAPNIVRVSGLEAAEMVKLINNAFRDVSFAFSNELATICDLWNLDAVGVIEAANMGYPRDKIPVPSPGVGGLCLVKDPLIYAWAGREKGYEPALPVHGRRINAGMVNLVARKVLAFFERHGLSPEGRKIFIMGFAFKGTPETSDMRFSPTLDLLPLLREARVSLYGHDPIVPGREIAALDIVSVGVEDGFAEADAVIVMNNNPGFADLDLASLLPRMHRPGLVFDGWHVLSRHEVNGFEGIEYEGISGAL